MKVKEEHNIEFAHIHNQNGHLCLKKLCYTGGGSLAYKYASIFIEFNTLVKRTWELALKKNKVKYIYDLPSDEFEKCEKQLRRELLDIWNNAKFYMQGERQFRKVFLAVKIICFNDYGFLNIEEERHEQKS